MGNISSADHRYVVLGVLLCDRPANNWGSPQRSLRLNQLCTCCLVTCRPRRLRTLQHGCAWGGLSVPACCATEEPASAGASARVATTAVLASSKYIAIWSDHLLPLCCRFAYLAVLRNVFLHSQFEKNAAHLTRQSLGQNLNTDRRFVQTPGRMVRSRNDRRVSVLCDGNVERDQQSAVTITQHRLIGVEGTPEHQHGAVLAAKADPALQLAVQGELTEHLEAVSLYRLSQNRKDPLIRHRCACRK